MQLSGSGDLDGAQLDRAGDERNFALRESEAFKCDRKGFGKVKTVSYHLSEFITQLGDITQAGKSCAGVEQHYRDVLVGPAFTGK